MERYKGVNIYPSHCTARRPHIQCPCSPSIWHRAWMVMKWGWLWKRIIEIIRGGFNLIYNQWTPETLSEVFPNNESNKRFPLTSVDEFRCACCLLNRENIMKLKFCIISYHCPKFNKNVFLHSPFSIQPLIIFWTFYLIIDHYLPCIQKVVRSSSFHVASLLKNRSGLKCGLSFTWEFQSLFYHKERWNSLRCLGRYRNMLLTLRSLNN